MTRTSPEVGNFCINEFELHAKNHQDRTERFSVLINDKDIFFMINLILEIVD